MSADLLRWCLSKGNKGAQAPDDVDYYPPPSGGVMAKVTGKGASWRSMQNILGTQVTPDGEPTSKHASFPQFVHYQSLPVKPLGTTRFVIISDTHLFHEKLKIPDGDVLVHCGDILFNDAASNRFLSWSKTKDFFKWFNKQPHREKIVICGNHDLVMERYGPEAVRGLAAPNVHYLCDEWTHVAGFNIYGSPRSLGKSRNTAFQNRATWALAPEPIDRRPNGAPCDVLITHQSTASHELRTFLAEVNPQVAHFSGHEHELHGLTVAVNGDGKEIPTFNAAITQGTFGKEWLSKVTVVDLPTPTHGRHYTPSPDAVADAEGCRRKR